MEGKLRASEFVREEAQANEDFPLMLRDFKSYSNERLELVRKGRVPSSVIPISTQRKKKSVFTFSKESLIQKVGL